MDDIGGGVPAAAPVPAPMEVPAPADYKPANLGRQIAFGMDQARNAE